MRFQRSQISSWRARKGSNRASSRQNCNKKSKKVLDGGGSQNGPPGGPRRLPRRFQLLQDASKVPWRRVLQAKTLKSWFLTDVLNGIHVFGWPRTLFSHPRTIKNGSKTSTGESWWRRKKVSETGTHQKSFLSPGTLREIPAFEPWTLEMGPQLYIYIYI